MKWCMTRKEQLRPQTRGHLSFPDSLLQSCKVQFHIRYPNSTDAYECVNIPLVRQITTAAIQRHGGGGGNLCCCSFSGSRSFYDYCINKIQQIFVVFFENINDCVISSFTYTTSIDINTKGITTFWTMCLIFVFLSEILKELVILEKNLI